MPISRFGEFDHATKLAPPPPQTTDPSGADLSFVRHLRHYLTRNPITMNRLPLCPKKDDISALVRHPPVRNPRSPRSQRPAFPTSHIPQPTTYIPNHPVRHRPTFPTTDDERTTTNERPLLR
jgi:hypothetical protein